MTEHAANRWARRLAWASTIAMLAAWGVVSGLGDRIWWALPFLYGPRWAAGALFVGILPAVVLARRTAIVAGGVMALVFGFGLLDIRLGLGRFEPKADTTLRIMEINAGSGSPTLHPTAATILAEAERVRALRI